MDPKIRSSIDAAITKNQIMNNTSNYRKTGDQQSPGSDVDFGQLISQSNREIKAQRNAVKNGDLSVAETDKELYELLNQQSTVSDSPSKTNLGKDDFMKLFVAQLQNQDPLNPKDDTEMAAQLAQFNGLEQMLNVNKKLEKLSDIQTQGHSINLVQFVGKEIMSQNGKVEISDNDLASSYLSLDKPVNNARVELRNKNGKLVMDSKLANLNSGESQLSLKKAIEFMKEKNGREDFSLEDGVYTINLFEVTDGGAEREIPVNSVTMIEGVDMTNLDNQLHTKLGSFSKDQIKEIGEKGFYSSKMSSRIKGNSNNLAPAPQIQETVIAPPEDLVSQSQTNPVESAEQAPHTPG